MSAKNRIGGLQPFTTIDFPGRLAAVLFLQGCNLRCSYCHNPGLIDGSGETIPWDSVWKFLKGRQGLLDGVVISGGEPTISPDLEEMMKEIKGLGFEVALQTNGCFPQRLSPLLDKGLLNFVAMDVKAPFARYHQVTRVGEGQAVRDSAEMLVKSGLAYEFRTTVHPDLLDDEAVLELAGELQEIGAQSFVLQKYQPGKVLDPRLPIPFHPYLIPATVSRLRSSFPAFSVRGEKQSSLR